ncbi:hypothetical protein C8J57DRAFT_1531263 [Mycena rebaudengoi]|nr:hypothetical protein C8J57DRAFT_1531263 [Mycena rebaudengoi]
MPPAVTMYEEIEPPARRLSPPLPLDGPVLERLIGPLLERPIPAPVGMPPAVRMYEEIEPPLHQHLQFACILALTDTALGRLSPPLPLDGPVLERLGLVPERPIPADVSPHIDPSVPNSSTSGRK